MKKKQDKKQHNFMAMPLFTAGLLFFGTVGLSAEEKSKSHLYINCPTQITCLKNICSGTFEITSDDHKVSLSHKITVEAPLLEDAEFTEASSSYDGETHTCYVLSKKEKIPLEFKLHKLEIIADLGEAAAAYPVEGCESTRTGLRCPALD